MNNNIIKTQIKIKDHGVGVIRINNIEYISLTDIASYADSEGPSDIIRNWMSSKDAFQFYSLWEEINNPNFNSVESHVIKINDVPYNRFSMSPKKWKERFNAIGIIPSSGKYSKGTYAHPDIAFEFASWISPEFKLYLITEFERLKKDEAYRHNIEWNANRMLSKVNYLIHTEAIKENIIPIVTEQQIKYIYAEEADVLNVALFGMTAKEWRNSNPNLKGNIRDYASIIQLLILCNLENTNADMIERNIPQSDRLIKLNQIAIKQMKMIENNKNLISNN